MTLSHRSSLRRSSTASAEPAGPQTAPPRAGVALAVGRAVIGLGLVSQPAALLVPFGVDRVTARTIAWVPRMVGARELALAFGALVPGRYAPARRGWVLASVLADGGDAVALGLALRGRTVPRALGALGALTAAGAVVVSVAELLGVLPEQRRGAASPGEQAAHG